MSSIEESEAWFEANAERWLEPLREWTIPAEMVPLSEGAARALSSSPEADSAAVGLDTLAKAIDGAIAALQGGSGAGPGGVFVKLSSRSPKDATIADDRMRAEFDRLVADGAIDRQNPDSLMRGLLRSSLVALRVQTGQEAVGLLKMSHRIKEDLDLALAAREATGSAPESELMQVQVMVRPWVPGLLPATEFRAIVYGGELRGISQYFSECYFAELAAEGAKERIRDRIMACFAEVKPRIALQNYVIDFAVLPERVLVIELNVYAPSTGVCLYSWAKDRKTVFEGGSTASEVELRIVTRPLSKGALKHAVMERWRPFIDHLYTK